MEHRATPPQAAYRRTRRAPTRRLGLAAVAAAVLAQASLAGAQAPVVTPDPDPDHLGRYIVTIETPPVLDYTWTTTLDAGGNVTTTVLTQSARGRITGTSTTSGPAINTAGDIRGRVSVRDGLPFVRMRTVEHGDVAGDEVSSRIRMLAHLEGWGDAARLVGQLRQRYCSVITDPIRQRKKRLCVTNTPQVDQAASHFGTWEARLALDVAGDRVIGAGSISTGIGTGEGRTADVAVDGRVSSGVATVKLTPFEQSVLGGSVTLVGPLVPDGDGQMYFAAVHEVKGKLLGQSFDEVYGSVP